MFSTFQASFTSDNLAVSVRRLRLFSQSESSVLIVARITNGATYKAGLIFGGPLHFSTGAKICRATITLGRVLSYLSGGVA